MASNRRRKVSVFDFYEKNINAHMAQMILDEGSASLARLFRKVQKEMKPEHSAVTYGAFYKHMKTKEGEYGEN